MVTKFISNEIFIYIYINTHSVYCRLWNVFHRISMTMLYLKLTLYYISKLEAVLSKSIFLSTALLAVRPFCSRAFYVNISDTCSEYTAVVHPRAFVSFLTNNNVILKIINLYANFGWSKRSVFELNSAFHKKTIKRNPEVNMCLLNIIIIIILYCEK